MVVVMAFGALRAGVLAACAAGALAVFLGNAAAQPASHRTASQAERDHRAAAAQARRLQAQVARNEHVISDLDSRLIAAGQRRAAAEAAANEAETRLAELRLQVAADTAQVRRDQNTLEATLMAAAFAERRFEPDSVHAGMAAAALAPAVRGRLEATTLAIAEARQRDQQIAAEQARLDNAKAQIDAERAEIVNLLVERRGAQASLLVDVAAADRRAQRFAAEAQSLRELAQRVALRRTAPRAGSSGAGIVPAAWQAPAQGQILRPYGDRTAGGPPAQGAVLRTRAGAQVLAPTQGQVAYAGRFRSYGQVLILNLDGGYVLVLTGVASMRVQVGEQVSAGQPIGEMAVAATPAPELYVEVRRSGRSIDPARWLSAQGLTAERDVERSG